MRATTDWRKFRKIAERPSAKFLRLPCWVRGYSSEMIRVAEKPGGRLCETTDIEDLAVVLRAQPDELDMLRKAVELLLERGTLEVRDGALYLPNFDEAQESSDAKRVRANRARRSNRPGRDRGVTNSSNSSNDCDSANEAAARDADSAVGETQGQDSAHADPKNAEKPERVTDSSNGSNSLKDQTRSEIPLQSPKGDPVASSSPPGPHRRPPRDPMPNRDMRKPADAAARWAFEHWRQSAGKRGAKPDPKRLGLLWDRYAERPDTWADDWPRVVAGALERAKALRSTPERGIRPERVIDISHMCHDAEIFERYRDWGRSSGPIDLEAEYS